MPPIINAQGMSKRYGSTPLFENISFTVSEGDRVGLIGPNGSGKSTLLEILYGRVKPDTGDVATRKNVRVSYVTQISEFAPDETVRSVIDSALKRAAAPSSERDSRLAESLGQQRGRGFMRMTGMVEMWFNSTPLTHCAVGFGRNCSGFM